MKYKEIKELTTEEIVARLREERIQYTKLKFNHAVSPLDNPMKLKASRRMIARLFTELNARKFANS